MRRCRTTAHEKQNAEASDARRFSQIILILSFSSAKISFFCVISVLFSGQ